MSQHRKSEPCQFCLKPTLNPPRQVPAPMPLSDIWCDDCDKTAALEYQKMWEEGRRIIKRPEIDSSPD